MNFLIIKKCVLAISILAMASPALADRVEWCGADKDNGQVNRSWCWSSLSNCEQGKPSHYVCVALLKRN
jgi:hypothetical protein